MAQDERAILRCISPIDGSVEVERALTSMAEVARAVEHATAAQHEWRRIAIDERCARLGAAVDSFVAEKTVLAEEISRQMGRPIAFAPGEIDGFEERARHMIEIAPACLADIATPPRPGFTRFIRREALGIVFVVAPWNYPYLTAVNAVVPALLAGNAVLLKHSSQTPLCSERIADLFTQSGLPAGLVQSLHLSHAATLGLIEDPAIDYVAFTGSVEGGKAIQRAARERFIATGLELGGKDPAYIRADADLDAAVEGLVDGAFFNSGQSCCGIERIYVARERFDDFVDGAVEAVKGYRLGSPLDPDTNLGPMVRTSAADHVRGQIDEALARGARPLIDPGHFPANEPGTPYLAPQILVDVDHSMAVMSEESFGPVVGIMPVDSDEQATRLMNDSVYGLTASIWSQDVESAMALGDRLETGTVFLNRADYLDPALAWTGVKDSGRGCTLSPLGFEAFVRPKSFHLKHP